MKADWQLMPLADGCERQVLAVVGDAYLVMSSVRLPFKRPHKQLSSICVSDQY